MSQSPIVTVLMPVYNCAAHLRESVDSILKQSFADFELLIVEDGSTDESPKLLAEAGDRRIKVLSRGEHLGLTRALKWGVEQAEGRYVARMDADDVALPSRFEKQVEYLEKHPEVGLVGTACRNIDWEGRMKGKVDVATEDLEIRWRSLLGSPFIHPTVMFRRDVFEKNNLNYDEQYEAAQDYDLWARALQFTKGSNLSEPLLLYRTHQQGVTGKSRELQLRNHDSIALRQIRSELPDVSVTPEQLTELRELFVGGIEGSKPDAERIVPLAKIYLGLLTAFLSRKETERDLPALRRREMAKLAKLAVRSRKSRGALKFLISLIAGEPAVLPALVGSVFRRAGRTN